MRGLAQRIVPCVQWLWGHGAPVLGSLEEAELSTAVVRGPYEQARHGLALFSAAKAGQQLGASADSHVPAEGIVRPCGRLRKRVSKCMMLVNLRGECGIGQNADLVWQYSTARSKLILWPRIAVVWKSHTEWQPLKSISGSQHRTAAEWSGGRHLSCVVDGELPALQPTCAHWLGCHILVPVY
jgi:hypothetical protein